MARMRDVVATLLENISAIIQKSAVCPEGGEVAGGRGHIEGVMNGKTFS